MGEGKTKKVWELPSESHEKIIGELETMLKASNACMPMAVHR